MNEMYDKQEIARLLDRFMAGTTSLDEERMLAAYFRTHEAGDEWQEYKEMFALFDSGAVDIEPEPVVAKPKTASLRWLFAAIAASVLLLLTIHFNVSDTEAPPSAPPFGGMPTGQIYNQTATDTRAISPLTTTEHIANAGTQSRRMATPTKRKRQAEPSGAQGDIYSAMLPEVVFCPEPDVVLLPQVGKQPSFVLACRVVLPGVSACADSTTFAQGTEVMVACDEIEYNDQPFKHTLL